MPGRHTHLPSITVAAAALAAVPVVLGPQVESAPVGITKNRASESDAPRANGFSSANETATTVAIDLSISVSICQFGCAMLQLQRHGVMAMSKHFLNLESLDDAELSSNLKLAKDARQVAVLMAQVYPSTDFGRAQVEYITNLDGVIADLEQALKTRRAG
jgi:hypothetical protein